MNRIPVLIDAWPKEAQLPSALLSNAKDAMLSLVTVSREKETAEGDSAVAVMERILRESEVPVGLVVLGSCTNTAVLLHTCPGLKQKIAWVSLAAGSFRGGDVSVSAERNIFSDPESAYVLLHSGLKIYLTAMEIDEEIDAEVSEAVLKDSGLSPSSPEGKRAVRNCIASLAGINPSLFEIRPCSVEIELQGRFSRGAMVKDGKNLWKKQPNVLVVEGIHPMAFPETIRTLRSCGKERIR